MKIKFNKGDKVKFLSEINGSEWEVLRCINLLKLETATFEDEFAMGIVPIYECKTIDSIGIEIVNNIAENLIDHVN